MIKRTQWTWLRGILFCLGAVVLNVVGTVIGSRLGDIFYFDTIGTMIVAAVSGYFPGILVALLSNILTSVIVPSRAYYAIINVLIAVVTTYFYNRGYLRHFVTRILYVLIIAFFGGALSNLIEWGISGHLFAEQMGLNLLHNIPDKIICAVIAYAVVHAMPMHLREMMHNVGWMQNPVSDRVMKEIRKDRSRHMSIRTKIVIALVVASVAIAVVVVAISVSVFAELMSSDIGIGNTERLQGFEREFIVRVISMCSGFLVLIIAAGIWLAKYHIIYPLNTMVYRSKRFDFSDEQSRIHNVEKIRDVGIHTGDEIENLYFAYLQSIEETMVNFTYMNQRTEELDKFQSGLIMVLADLVENRDSSSGDHVRKTASYVAIALYKMREMGFYTDQLTDKFISDVIKSAPLHDIGKIQIPDAILNKPARLTDEEFEIMKKHTVFGAAVLQQALDTLPYSDYLREAKNLTAHHHEKWNGTGYPDGLAGEDIPLSARVMAVADVFDALVSKRCYKEPYSFEDAMEIIRKDAGTHFDPKVAEAFLAAADEVRATSERYMDMAYTTKDIIR